MNVYETFILMRILSLCRCFVSICHELETPTSKETQTYGSQGSHSTTYKKVSLGVVEMFPSGATKFVYISMISI